MGRMYPHDDAERVLDALIVPALRRAIQVLNDRWAEVQLLATQLETEREIGL
jgi:hypothetical protein